MMTLPRKRRRDASGQRGNALIAALLALAVSGLTAATVLKNRQIEMKREAGLAESTVLEKLRNAVSSAMIENLSQIQQGQPVVKGDHSFSAESVNGELVWRPTIQHLRAMGYLPEGWTATTSSVNGAPYAISFRRSPPGCLPAACDVEGQIVITGPILDSGPGAPVDGVLVGPILTRAGADGGVSLATSPAVITGFGGTWSVPNPVPGNPAGVVALRVGTNTGGFNQFVRIGDLRDPSLQGDLSAGGNLSIAGSTTLNGPATINGSVSANDSTGTPCVTLDRAGMVNVACAGRVNARTGAFTEQVTADGGVVTPSATLFAASDPNAIRVNGNEMFVRGPAGTLISFRGGDVMAEGSLGGSALALTDAVEEGSACGLAGASTGVQYSASNDGSFATCVGGRWVVISRIGRSGANCLPGSTAVDPLTSAMVVCRGARYVPITSILSNFVLMDTVTIQMSGGASYLPKPSCAADSLSGEALIILIANNEGVLATNSSSLSGVNRFALDRGSGWDVHLQRSADNSPLDGTLIATIYCYYP